MSSERPRVSEPEVLGVRQAEAGELEGPARGPGVQGKRARSPRGEAGSGRRASSEVLRPKSWLPSEQGCPSRWDDQPEGGTQETKGALVTSAAWPRPEPGPLACREGSTELCPLLQERAHVRLRGCSGKRSAPQKQPPASRDRVQAGLGLYAVWKSTTFGSFKERQLLFPSGTTQDWLPRS